MEDTIDRGDLDWRRPSPCPIGPGKKDLKGEKLTFEMKFWLGKTALQGVRNGQKVADRYNLTKQTIHNYSKAVKKWPIIFHTGGRPPLLNTNAAADLNKIVEENQYNLSKDKFNEEALKLAKNTAAERGKLSFVVTDVSPRTLRRLCFNANKKF